MSVSFNKSGIITTSCEQINPNLLINTDFEDKNTVTAWNQDKNGMLTATNWGGYNAGVKNPTTVYHAHLIMMNGEYVYQYTRTADETWLGVSQNGLQTLLQANTTYTWSIDEYRPTGANNYITAGLYYYKESGGTRGFWAGYPHGTGDDVRDQWVRRYYTFTVEEILLNQNVQFYIYGHSGGQGTVYMRRPKLEIGDKPTPWVPSSSEGYASSSHGFIQSVSSLNTSIYENFIESINFIEY